MLIDNGVVDHYNRRNSHTHEELINNIMPKQTRLNPKQKLFVEIYLQTYNASEACRQSGYSESMATKLMQNVLVSNAINQGINSALKKAKIDNQSVLGQLTQMAMEQDPVSKGMKWSDKLRALELLGKHLGIFRAEDTTDANVPQVTINFEGDKDKKDKPHFEIVDYDTNIADSKKH